MATCSKLDGKQTTVYATTVPLLADKPTLPNAKYVDHKMLIRYPASTDASECFRMFQSLMYPYSSMVGKALKFVR